MNLAIFSPNQNPYSETFIQAHKNYIKADKLYYIYGGSFENMIIENVGPIVNKRKRLAIKGLSKLMNASKKPDFTKAVSNKLKSLKVDVALIEYGNHAEKLIEVLKTADIPFVVHFHGYEISVRNTILANNNYKKLFESASYVVGVSKLMCKNLQDLGCPQKKIIYTACPANPSFENIQPDFENKQALAIGRFVDKKSPYYTILAFKKVIKYHPDAKLIMVGHGILHNTCKNLIKHYGLSDNIQLVGVKTPDQIKRLMQESYCFIQHSITTENGNQEGTPVAIMEAALAGLPIISTFHAGIPDVIEHEKTGLLSAEHDVEAMAEHIIRVFNNLIFAKSIGDSAKRIHRKKYSMDNHIKTIQDLLKKTVSR